MTVKADCLHLLGQGVQHVKTGANLFPLWQLSHHKLQSISQAGCQAMIELVLCRVLPSVCDSIWVGMVDNYHGLVDLQHVLFHSLSLLLPDFIEGLNHGVILRYITECMIHVLQKLSHHKVGTILQKMYPPAGVSPQAIVDVLHHALLVLVQPNCTSNLQRVYVTSTLGSIDLKIGMSSHAGANHFSPHCCLLWQRVLGASLTVEYPSESAPPWSGKDGSELPTPSLIGCALGGLPLAMR